MAFSFRSVSINDTAAHLADYPANGIGLPVGSMYFVSDAGVGDALVWHLVRTPGSDVIYWWVPCCHNDGPYYYGPQP